MDRFVVRWRSANLGGRRCNVLVRPPKSTSRTELSPTQCTAQDCTSNRQMHGQGTRGLQSPVPPPTKLLHFQAMQIHRIHGLWMCTQLHNPGPLRLTPIPRIPEMLMLGEDMGTA
eukprot:CAMPEP_0115395568 /NCGR_PEP_ID=MMETSP0271-20121206/12853_1 /TAXON_ID=71861 /ORGANISM="Scrippsiella trochoidea, Strain CCMP3099" /LENGTH=114 /DNA_ID=CAMNT_0002819283 /DNA_START=195 /DNA_END=539 /DNA_ORIENTATION=-